MIVKGVKISELELRNELTGKENIPFQDSFFNGKLNLEGVIDYFQKVTNQNISLQSLVNIKQCIQSASELEFYASNVGDVYFNTGDKKLYMYQEDGTYTISDPSKTQLYVFLTPLDSEKSDAIYRWDENSKQFIVPSYVDDVIEVYATYDVSPIGQLNNIKLYKDAKHTQAVIGEVGKIYINIEEGQPAYSFRWSGSIWVSVNDGGPLIIGEITGTAYDGGKGKHNKDIIDSLPDTVLSNVSSTVEKTGTTNKINVNNKKRGSDELYVNNTDSSVTLVSSTDTEAGLMAAADKKLFDSMPKMWLTENTTITTAADKVTVVQPISRVIDGVYADSGNLYRDIPAATTTTAGIMTAADKVRLDTGVAEDIQAEREAREAADRQLQSNIDAEASTRSQADTALGNRITTESSDREAADTALGGRIDKEIADRGDAIDAVTDKINTEIADRKAAITAEETARTQADEALRTDLNAEVTRAKNAENNITANYQSADSAINTRISTEIADRKQADTELQQAISAETTRATGKEAELSTAISNETTERQKGDQDNNTKITEVSNQLNGFIATKGQPNGFASLDSKGLIPSSQLPAYVDDVIEVATFDELPEVGEAGKIYVTLDTNLTYRWSGTRYIEISQSLALGETSSTAYAGDKGKVTTDIVTSIGTKVGLTTIVPSDTAVQINSMGIDRDDLDSRFNRRIVSLDIQSATTTKAGVMSAADKTKLNDLKTQEGITADISAVQSNLTTHITNKQNPHSVTKAQVGLGNVDNTSDADKPVSTAVQTELDKKTNSAITDIDFANSTVDNAIMTVDLANGITTSEKNITLPKASSTSAGIITSQESIKLNKILTNGDGTKFLADNGTYITVETGVNTEDVYTFIPTISDGKVKQSDFDNLLAAINDHKIIMIDYGLGELQSTGYYIPAMAWYDNSNIIISYNIDVFKYFIGIQSDLLISADSTRIANEDEVLLKNNTDEYTPTNKYNPATKKYVDDLSSGSTIEISDASLLTTNANLSDTAASNWIISIFGNEQSFRNVVSDIISNRTRYWFNVTGVNANVIEMSSVNVYKSQNGTIYELHFIITYYIADTQITKRISIIQTSDSYHVKINDIMQSNNLTTATKISATDYAALSPKDANTMYAVTE